MSDRNPEWDQEEDPPLPRGPGDRIVTIAAGVIFLLLALTIFVDTPLGVSRLESWLSSTLLRVAIVIALAGFAIVWRRKRQRGGDE